MYDRWNCFLWVILNIFCWRVTHSLETDGGGDGVDDCVGMGEVGEMSSLDTFEVHGLKRQEEIRVQKTAFLLRKPDWGETWIT